MLQLQIHINIGASINVMKKSIMDELKLNKLYYTPTVLQLVYRSIIKLENILEDIHGFLHSSKYLIDFMVPAPKTNLRYHSLVLGRLCLAKVNTFISYRSRDMITVHT